MFHQKIEIDSLDPLTVVKMNEEPTFEEVFLKEEALDIEINCISCDKSFQNDDIYALHIQLAHSRLDKSIVIYKPEVTIKNESKFKCQICLKAFDKASNFRNHKKRAHKTIPNLKLQCDLCSSILKNKLCIIAHMKQKHLGFPRKTFVPASLKNQFRDGKFSCKFCSKNYRSYQNLIQHEKMHEKDEPKDNQCDKIYVDCPTCHEVFSSKEECKNHVYYHHPSIKHQFKCKDCDKSYNTKVVLQIHEIAVHQKIKDLEKSKLLEVQMLRDCELNGINNSSRRDTKAVLICNLCTEKVSGRQELLQHMTDKHFTKVNPKVKFEAFFGCIECKRKFTDQRSLIYHMRTHTGNKPSICPKCPKKFVKAGDLKRHLMSHHGAVKPFSCSLCDKAYTRKYLFTNHVKKCHAT